MAILNARARKARRHPLRGYRRCRPYPAGTFDRLHFRGRRHVLDDRIQHGLHTLVLEGRTAQYGNNLIGQGTRANALLDLFLGQLDPFEVLFHQLVGGLGRSFDHVLAHLVTFVDHVCGHVRVLEGHALIVFAPEDGLVLDQVDNALEVFLGTDSHLQRHRVGAQTLLQLLDHHVEIRAGAVHLVDENHARHFVLVGLAPDGLGLRLHTGGAAQHHHRTIQHTQGTLYLNGEVHVPGGVDDIDAVLVELGIHALPETGGRRRGNGNTPLLLLLHPVHGGRTIVHLTNLVGQAGVEKNALGGRGFTRVHVRTDTDIAIPADRSLTCHD